MASLTFCFLVFAALVTFSTGMKMFDKGDCSITAEAMEIAVTCAEPYEDNLAEMTDDRYNKMTPKQQETARANFQKMAICGLKQFGGIDDDEVLQKDVIIDNYKNTFILEPECRKDILIKKVEDCFRNYKSKDQNKGVAFCIGFGQQIICDKTYKSTDPDCKLP